MNKDIDSGSLRVRGMSTSDGADNHEVTKLNGNGEVDVSEMRIEDMSADDIRVSLRRWNLI